MKKILLVLLAFLCYETASAIVLTSDTITRSDIEANNCTIVVKPTTTIKFKFTYNTSSWSVYPLIFIDQNSTHYEHYLWEKPNTFYFNVPASSLSEGPHKAAWLTKKSAYYFPSSDWYNFYVGLQINRTCCSHITTDIFIAAKYPKRWEKSTDDGQTWTHIPCTSRMYTESDPSAGIVLYRALNNDNSYSDIVTITYVDAVPSTIQTLPTTSTKTVDESITLAADLEDKNYLYQWKKDGADIVGATQSTYTISTIKSSHAGNYTCYISNGCNGVTTTVSKLAVNKCTQTINFPDIPIQIYSSGLTYTLPKTTDKGLTITYQSMNKSVATVSGNVITIKAPGTAIISASQVGNNDYLEATQVSRTLTVNKRSQVIIFNELPEKTYEDLPFTLPEKTDEGLTISYVSTNTSVATISGNTVTILKPGVTDIIASQAGDATHYSATDVSQTLVVKKASQSLSFESLPNKTYGDAPFELKKVSNKNLPISYTSSDSSIASVSGNMVTINKPGTVTITARQSGNAYYLAIEPVEKTLTINKANQVINFPAIDSRAYGSDDFILPSQTDKNQTISYESSNLEVATIVDNVVHIVGAGSTEITAHQEGNEYYHAAPTVSQILTITKAYQTINFPELPSYVYGQDSIRLNATVSSGLSIEYESSDYSIATIHGNLLTIVGAGQCYITASVAGNKNYYTATPVEQKLIVTKAQPTINFAPLASEYIYGDGPITLNANGNAGEIKFSSSNPSKLTIVDKNAYIQGAGTFTITAFTTEDDNHLSASVSQEITINKAPLTVIADNLSRIYGNDNPALTYSYKGFVNGDTKFDLTTSIQVSSLASISSPVGTYEIDVIASTDDNYDVVCKKGVLTINKAPLTISAQGSREYGENNPDFEYSYTGFKNDETTDVMISQPQAYTTAKRSSPAGIYPIYLSGAMAKNYEITYNESFLLVQKAPLTIQVLDATRKRLEENPKFELSITGYKLEETIDVLDKLPTIQCEANCNSPAGTYPIILLNDGVDANYEYVLVNGILTIEKLQFTISVESNDEMQGTVSGGGTYDENTIIHIYAISKPHHHFIQWEDGNKDIDRIITVIQDTTYKAIFAIDQHVITASVNDGTKGFVSGYGEYNYGTTIELYAVPYEGFQFNRWSDGNTENPRKIEVTQNASYTAEFGVKQCVVSVTTADYEMGRVFGSGTYDYGTYVELRAEAYSGYTFSHWSNRKTYNPYTLIIKDDLNLVAYFMDESLEDAEETNVQFEANTPLDSMIVNTTANTANFIWPAVTGASMYSLVIWANNEQTEKLLTLTFNASGQLFNLDFATNAPRQMCQQSDSAENVLNMALAFTVTGLTKNSTYKYAMEAKDKNSSIIDSTQGSFVTSIATDVNTKELAIPITKIIRDGQLLILRAGKTYTVMGQEL